MNEEKMLEQVGETGARISVMIDAAFVPAGEAIPAQLVFVATATGMAMVSLAERSGMTIEQFDRLQSWLRVGFLSRTVEKKEEARPN